MVLSHKRAVRHREERNLLIMPNRFVQKHLIVRIWRLRKGDVSESARHNPDPTIDKFNLRHKNSCSLLGRVDGVTKRPVGTDPHPVNF